MASTAMVHVRIEKQLKAKATKALAAMGLSVSDATRLLLTRVAAEQALPFEVKVPNAKTVTAMKQAATGRVRAARTVSAALVGLNEDD